MNKFQKSKSKVGPLENKEGNKTSNPYEMAEILKEQYMKAFNPKKSPNEINLNHINDSENTDIRRFFDGESHFSDITVSTTDVIKAISETNIKLLVKSKRNVPH